MSDPVYLDHAATTPIDPRVIAAMLAVMGPDSGQGNPAAVQHPYGQRAGAAVAAARGQVALLIGAEPREIVFTSGATEANNLAIKGACAFYQARGRHLVTALTEHPSVLEPVAALEAQGWRVTRLRPAADGRIPPDQLAAALRPDTALVSLMHVNNETGIIQDIAALGELCRARDVRFHVDAAQSAGRLALDVRALAVDYLSLSAHKFYGPQGIGVLYVRDWPRAGLTAQMHGGGQERGRRAGTLAVHQIVGMGAAAEILITEREAEQARLATLMTRLEAGLADIPGLLWIGANAPRVAGIRNVAIRGVARESLLASLWQTVAAATGSACTAAEGEPSTVLQALGLDPVTAQGALRLSPGRWTSAADINRAVAALRAVITRLRRIAAGEPVDDQPGPTRLPPAFSAAVTDWFARLPRVGRLAPGPDVLHGAAGEPRQGARAHWDLAIEGRRIARARFRAWGCPATLAAAAWCAERIEGLECTTAEALTGAEMAAALGLTGAQRGTALIIEDALKNALAKRTPHARPAQDARCPS
ncbi:MAG: hypothetical protein AMXMBFR76_09050 [Pseudomonadota bacterium]